MTTATTLTLPAPAKLNLGLHICGRRTDGYHNLQTVFQFIDVCDELRFTLRADDRVTVDPPLAGVTLQQNLIYRAAVALKQHSGCPLGAEIHITKRLPMGGGIGGGSSNAATTLVALNALWQCNLSRDQLKAIGVTLGADVPVFIHGHAAFAEGVGERLQDVDIPEPWYLVLVPQVHVSTAHVFSHQELTRHSEIMKMSAFLGQGSRNDCEALVRKLYPAVDEALRWLNRFGLAQLTGTGACVYCAHPVREQVEAIAAQVPKDWHWFIARGCNESPLYRALRA